MNDRRRAERAAGFRGPSRRPLRDERHHDELQPDERARGRADDHVEAFPMPELRHFFTSHVVVEFVPNTVRQAP